MSTTSGPPALPADFSFTFDPSLAAWNHSVETWLNLNSKHYDGLVASAFVFHPVTNRFLLIQRARHDSSPLLWEAPGGAVDREDPTILHGAARELFEEAGLKASHIRRMINDRDDAEGGKCNVFTTSRGMVVAAWIFEMEVKIEDMEEGVKLDPNEHEDYVWASEDEIIAGAVGDKKIPMASAVQKGRVLEAFRLRKLDGEIAA